MKTVKTSLLSSCMFAFSLAFFSFTAHAQQQKLTDPEIASIGVTANQVDINAGEFALTKTKNSDVKNFANTMINDHKAVIAQAVALVTKLKVTPQNNAVSKKLLADAAKTKAQLQKKSGKAFDKAYIDNEVAYHKAVISTVEKVLIPQTTNEELKQLLQNILPALRTHLEHAEMLQKNFK